MVDPLERYSRQILFPGIGRAGQEKLRGSTVFLCGCGALGSVLAETLTRAGVGKLRIVDRDFVEMSNLQRQVLFDETDAEERLPKAVAAERKLRRINSDVAVEGIVADVDHTNVLGFCEGVDLILDGTDNFEVRFLLNEASLETRLPWIYAGCVGSHGQTMSIFPHETACLRCLLNHLPEPGTAETCDTAGVIGPAIEVVAALEAVDALKILTGQRHLIEPVLTVVDVWDGTFRRMRLDDLRSRSDCPACRHGRREWLTGKAGSRTTSLCGRNAVQVVPADRTTLALDELARRLDEVGEVKVNPYLLRLELRDPPCELNVFADGRAIIKGTDDVALARALYARYIGH